MARRKPKPRKHYPAPLRHVDLPIGTIAQGKLMRGGGAEIVDVERIADDRGTVAVVQKVKSRTLDKLLARGHLSKAQAEAGNALRDLWERAGLHSAGKHGMSGYGGSGGELSECDDAIAFKAYNRAVRKLAYHERPVVIAVCIHDENVLLGSPNLRMLKRGLDALGYMGF